MAALLSVEEALALVLARARPLPPESVALAEAAGRTLAADAVSAEDHPPFRRSKVDGYALVAADAGAPLRVVAEIPAGKAPGDRIGRGEAARIFTGAPLPEGADAVAKQEDCSVVGDRVVAPAEAALRDNAVPVGAECRRGEVVLRAGETVTAAACGALAAAGAAALSVVRRPEARILATGSELVPCGETPPPGKIRNSNAPALATASAALGCRVASVDHAGDSRDELRDALDRALHADLVLVTGGVSVGDFDLVPEMLLSLGVERVLHGVRLQPGKPLWFGVRGATLVFGLPGNPVSALVNTALFVRPAVRAMQRRAAPAPFRVRLSAALGGGMNRRRYVPAKLGADGATRTAAPVRFAGSGDVFGFAAADVLLVVPEHAPPRAAGDEADAVPLCGISGGAGA